MENTKKAERTVTVGGCYRHFKGTVYRVKAIAMHTETEETLVVYEPLSGGKAYARPLDMFLSPVDREKYPDVDAVYRFEEIEE